MSRTEAEPKTRDVIDATQGFGPLLERDYRAVIEGADATPEDVGRMLREHFEEFAPPETAAFRRSSEEACPLEVGDELDIRIALRGCCRVRVVHHDARSVTLRTLGGHPEAGRITFGADRDERGRLRLRILSRTRASGLVDYLGYLVMGKQLQARCWIRFLDRLAERTGGRVEGKIHVRTRRAEPVEADRKGRDEPTFLCRDDGGG